MTYNNFYLYLDDLREPVLFQKPSDIQLVLCRTYKQAIAAVKNYKNNKSEMTLALDLDHDLGSKKTGYDFCKWIVMEGLKGEFHIHSANPVGVDNMRQLLTHYGWKEF